MPTPIKMPALSPTMEEGTLAKWLVKEGDEVSAGDIMAEIETDKATMEFEAVDEGTIVAIEVPEGTEGVKVGTVIATLAGEDEDPEEAKAAAASEASAKPAKSEKQESAPAKTADSGDKSDEKQTRAPAAPKPDGDRVIASPLARRIAEQKGVDLAAISGSGPNGRIVKADVEQADAPAKTGSAAPAAEKKAPAATQQSDSGAPFEELKLNNVRKVIARRLTEAKQSIPHIYLTVDVRLDALLKLRGELNASLESRATGAHRADGKRSFASSTPCDGSPPTPHASLPTRGAPSPGQPIRYHRSELPDRPPFLTARWERLCLATWAVPPVRLQPVLPPELDLENL